MISLQLMKSTVSPPFGSRLIKLSSDLDSDRRIYGRRDLRLQRRMKRVRVSCKIQEGGSQNNGEEPPESLFMKELRRRGITPSSILEESKKSRLEEGMAEKGGEQSFSKRNAVMTSSDKSLTNQREQSMALNSEGLEGLVPRAKLLLTLGGTFFLGFWPLILVTVASFAALYLYFGTDFVHDGTDTPAIPTPYVDPYELLQDERISETAPRVN